MTKLQYRGVSYDNAHHEQPSSQPVDHTYRGQHYEAPLRHDAASIDVETEFHYRGHVYQHRADAAARQVNDD
jgi:hypothetical protein